MYVFDKKMGRRKFIQVAGGGVAAATMSGCATMSSSPHQLPINSAGMAKYGREAGEWIPSCCNMCGGQSGILCHIVDGVVQKIEPNHWNPNNYTNVSEDFFNGYTEEYGCAEGGVLCPKGNAGIAQLYDPDRVKRPMKRTNPKKGKNENPRWKEISWDEAVSEIGTKLKELHDAKEAHKLLWWSEDHSFTHPQGNFCELYGTPNYSNHANLCDVSRKAGFKMVMGDERPLEDFTNTKYILLFGWNPTSAIKWVYLPRIITRAIENGARMVVVDPYLSNTAVKAHEHLRIRPATDGALALAMAHVIIREGLEDKEFIKDWTVGFDEFAEFVKDKTPEWAAEITTIPAEDIERIAIDIATKGPTIVDTWSGPGQHSNGTQGTRAIACLAGLIGGYDRPGTLMIPNQKKPKHAHPHASEEAEHTLEMERFDGKDELPFGHDSGTYARGFDRLLNGTGPYEPRVGICVFQNLLMNSPGSKDVAKALSKLEMFVVVDTMESETAWYADYLIPGTTYLERYDLNSHWVTWPVVALRQPVVKAKKRQTSPYPYQGGIHNQMAEYEFVAALGRFLGLKDADGVDVFSTGLLSGKKIDDLTEWYEDYLSYELTNDGPKMTLEELKALPGAVWVESEKGTEYEKYTKEIDPEKLAEYFVDGDIKEDGTQIYDKPKEEGGKRKGTVIRGKPTRGFYTPSGFLEFANKDLLEKKDANGKAVDPLPVYRERDWMPSKKYPLYLINWKEAQHTHTRTQSNVLLRELVASNPLIIHPDTAKKYGVKDGEEIWVESSEGKTKAVAKVTKRIHPEVVGALHGFGHWKMGSAEGKGTNFADLNKVGAFDAISGQALHKEICVKVYKT